MEYEFQGVAGATSIAAEAATGSASALAQRLSWLANWTRAATRHRTRLRTGEAVELIIGIGEAFGALEFSTEAGEGLARLLELLAAEAATQQVGRNG